MQPLSHLQPKPSPVQSTVGSAHQESDCTATSGHETLDPQPFQILTCEESAVISATMQQLPFLSWGGGGGNDKKSKLNFPWEKSHWDHAVVKSFFFF